MAHVASETPIVSGILHTVSDWFTALWNATHNQAAFEDRMRQIRKLEASSDADLAKLGISRDRIVHHVFRDLYYV